MTVFSPSLPPNHSKTTRIFPDVEAAVARLACASTYGTGPSPPTRLKPRPPAPSRIRSRRETPLPSLNRVAIGFLPERAQDNLFWEPPDGRSGIRLRLLPMVAMTLAILDRNLSIEALGGRPGNARTLAHTM